MPPLLSDTVPQASQSVADALLIRKENHLVPIGSTWLVSAPAVATHATVVIVSAKSLSTIQSAPDAFTRVGVGAPSVSPSADNTSS
jgi:hypothetical protein